MNSTIFTPLNIPNLLRKYNLHPRKGLGQNFLQDEDILRNIVKTASIKQDDDVLEIGPGVGNLTRHLASVSHSVTAVELDPELNRVFRDVVSPFPNINLIQGDILAMDPTLLMGESRYMVVANIPYYITAAVIRHLLETKNQPYRIVLTVQKEVAERICSTPGNMSLLALSVQVYGIPTISMTIPSDAFYPPPSVDSSVVRIDILSEPVIPPTQLDLFFKLIKAGFSQKRKTLRNSLASMHGKPFSEEILSSSGIDPMRRAETLSLAEWGILCSTYSSQKST